MWRTLKILVFLWPVPVMVYFIGSFIIGQTHVDEKLSDANGLVWGSGNEQISCWVKQTSSGEQDTYEITLVGNDGQTLEKNVFVIDKDMFGGGFIKAIQADDDQELELIVWGSHERDTSYLLDYSEGQISKKSFDQFPEDIRVLTQEWRRSHVTNRMTLFLLGIFFVSYYSIVGIIWVIIKAVQRFRTKVE